jgi:hypothetical protein
MNRTAFALAMAFLPSLARGDFAVVGSGTAASCTTAAYNTAMQILVDGPQARGGVLSFNCGAQPHTITIDREWGLTDDVVIDGAGIITLDGQNLHRFYQTFLLTEGRTVVTLKDISLIRGFAATDFGGAVYVRQGTSLTLEGVTIADSRAATSGGAVAADASTQLSIVDSAFLNNRAGDGGALAIRASTQINGSVFIGNRAEASNAQGGAIQSYEQPLTIANSTFQENLSARDGGAVLKRNASLVLDGVSLLRNNAPNAGAGLYADASVSVQADRVKVIGNVGDGMYVAGGLILRRSSFEENRNNGIAKSALAMNSSSSSLLVEKSTFVGNDNAIFLQRAADATGTAGTLRLDNVTVHNSNFSAIGILDGSGNTNISVDIDQSSVIEPNVTPLLLFGGRITYAGSMIFGGGNPNCRSLVDPTSQYLSGGNNLVGPGCPRIGSDGAVQTQAELQLSTLSDHGGDVKTLLPALTSPAIDRRTCVNVDARERPRPVDADQNGSALCDIGAVERQVLELNDVLFSDGFE